MITTVFFDLDGTLLPMDQEVFLNAYMGGLAAKLAPHGYEPNHLIRSIWKGTAAMVMNDGRLRNEDVFWNAFSAIYGRDTKADEPIFRNFYENEFQNVAEACGFAPLAAQVVRELKEKGKTLVLATNPLFPDIATLSRTKWAGLDPKDFVHITTYENSRYCKPNPHYYLDILKKLELNAEECLMVGNDVKEDMVCATLGMKVFLLTDCIINKENQDISQYPQGGFPELLNFIRSL